MPRPTGGSAAWSAGAGARGEASSAGRGGVASRGGHARRPLPRPLLHPPEAATPRRGAADAVAGTSTTVGPRSPRRLSLRTAAAAPDLDSGVVPFARRRARVGVVRADPAAPPPPAAERRGAAGAECRVQEGGERQRRSGAAWPCSLHELGHAGGPARAPPRELGTHHGGIPRARPRAMAGLLELRLASSAMPWRSPRAWPNLEAMAGHVRVGEGGRTIRCRLGCSRGRGAPLLSPNRFGADGRGNGSL